MLDLTMGGRCISGEKAIEFFESLPDLLPEEIKTDEFCNEYEYALNRLRVEVRRQIPIAPKKHVGHFITFNCGSCGFSLAPIDEYCPKCGRVIDRNEYKGAMI